METGAQTASFGLQETLDLMKIHGFNFKLLNGNSMFQIGANIQSSMRSRPIPVPMSEIVFIYEKVDVMSINIPFSIKLYFVDKYNMYVNNISTSSFLDLSV